MSLQFANRAQRRYQTVPVPSDCAIVLRTSKRLICRFATTMSLSHHTRWTSAGGTQFQDTLGTSAAVSQYQIEYLSVVEIFRWLIGSHKKIPRNIP